MDAQWPGRPTKPGGERSWSGGHTSRDVAAFSEDPGGPGVSLHDLEAQLGCPTSSGLCCATRGRLQRRTKGTAVRLTEQDVDFVRAKTQRHAEASTQAVLVAEAAKLPGRPVHLVGTPPRRGQLDAAPAPDGAPARYVTRASLDRYNRAHPPGPRRARRRAPDRAQSGPSPCDPAGRLPAVLAVNDKRRQCITLSIAVTSAAVEMCRQPWRRCCAQRRSRCNRFRPLTGIGQARAPNPRTHWPVLAACPRG